MRTGAYLPAKRGTPIHPDALTKWFRAFIKRNNFPDVHVHSLRHPYVKPTTKIKYSAFGWDWQMQSAFYLAFYVLLYETLDKLV